MESHGDTQCIVTPCRFVELVEELAHQDIVQQLGIVPVMCASATTPYALALVARLQAAAPNCIIHTQFLGPEELAKVRWGLCMSDISACCISAAEIWGGAIAMKARLRHRLPHCHAVCWHKRFKTAEWRPKSPPPPPAPLCRLFLHESPMLDLPCPLLQSLLILHMPSKLPLPKTFNGQAFLPGQVLSLS